MIKGADFSSLIELENEGAKFSDNDKRDAIAILSHYGFNGARIRLWVDPYDEQNKPYLGGTSDFKRYIALAKRAKKANMHIMLDFHFSDFWADPSKQFLPKAWVNDSFEEIKEQLYTYTKDVLIACQKEDVMPDYIQIGNEITHGMCWPHGILSEDLQANRTHEFFKLSELLKASIRAARTYAKEAKLLLHLDRGGEHKMYRIWFDEMARFNVDFDIIGVSYYPYWHGSLQDLKKNLNRLVKLYNKDLIVVETAFAYTTKVFKHDIENFTGLVINQDFDVKKLGYPLTIEGQAHYMKDFTQTLKSIDQKKCLGFYYWEPCWLPTSVGSWASLNARKYIQETHKGHGNEWANQALFDYHGKPLMALKTIKEEL